MESMIVMAVASLVVGLVVGVLAGLLGIGGGMLLVPVFKLAYAMDSIMCTATSLFTIIPTSVSGAVSHVRNKTCIPKLGIAAGLGGAVTSPLGVACGSIPGAALGARLVPRVPERRLRFLFAGFLVVAAAMLVVNQLGLLG